jgi:hypothetical protein
MMNDQELIALLLEPVAWIAAWGSLGPQTQCDAPERAAARLTAMREALLHCKRYAYRVSSHSEGHPFDRDNAQTVVDIADAALTTDHKGAAS